VTLTDERRAVDATSAPARRWAGRRAVLRLAQRDARRHRARSALVVTMIALPVFALTGVDVVARTLQADGGGPGQRLPAGADASAEWFGGRVLQSPDGSALSMDGVVSGSRPTDEQVAEALGAETVTRRTSGVGRLGLAEGRSLRVDVLEVDARDPLVAGSVTLLSGRLPEAPGEVLVTEAVALATGIEDGGALSLLRPARELTVTGTAQLDDTRRGVLGLPGALLDDAGSGSVTWLASTPDPVTWADVLRLNASGLVVVSRAVLADPPPAEDVPLFAEGHAGPDEDGRLDLVAFVALAAGMGLLEVVLLAGPAFAVGARRSKRILALLAACGGDRRQVRDVVLAQGLVLGAVGAAAGLALGVALGAGALPLLERYGDAALPAPVLRPLDLLAIAAAGLGTAVLAALLPARSVSRQDVALALAGRREQRRARTRVPVVGLVMALLGLLAVVTGVQRRSPLTILSGAALGQVGLVLCTPTIVVLTGRLARWLPLTPRLALRDSARNVGRTAPAVAAVMAAVAGTVAAGIVVASVAERDERMYTPQLPLGYLQVSVAPDLTPADLAAIEAEVAAVVDVEDAAVLRGVEDPACSGEDCRYVEADRATEQRCPLETLDRAPTDAELEAAARDGRCTGVYFGRMSATSVAVDDGTGLPALFEVDDPAAAQVLRAGGAAVVDPSDLADGVVRLRTGSPGPDGTLRGDVLEVPGVVIPVPRTGQWTAADLVIGPALAERLDVPVVPRELRVVPATPVSQAAEEELQRSLDRSGADAFAYVERGYEDRYRLGLLALVVGAAIITIGAVATSTALAMTDARPDLATMSAVGASRSARRRMALTTALVLALLGTALGAVAGAVPGIAAVRALQQPAGSWFMVGGADDRWPLVIPWPFLLVTAFAVPLAAGLLVALFTRARLPVVHRRDA
jgi:putative ABC transport system permease protein